MSNDEVRRWKAVASIKTRSPFVSIEYVEGDVVSACDHDRIVAEKDAEIARLKSRNKKECPRCEFWDRLPSDTLKDEQTIATQKRVIEKLKTYVQHRVDCICRAGVLQYSDSCDCGLDAIENGEA